MADATKIKGTVKWFDVRKGFGFIEAEDGKDFFVHFSGISNGRHYNGLEEGDQVEFDLEDTQKGPKAVNVNMTVAAPRGKKAAEPTSSTENTEPAE